MDVDGSFAEYVVARWSMLHRLATLLVGPDGADELARTALVRAYLSWPEVQDSSSADAAVKRILAGAAVKGAGEETRDRVGEDDDRSGSDRLWAAISALPPRQRATLVLRHFELMSDAEIAGALGCSTASVTAEALALETGIDVTELREELLHRGETVIAPQPPLDALLVAGREERRRRRRRGWTWAAGVAAAVAAALVLANLVEGASGPTEEPQPASAARDTRFLSMLPSGRPPRIAYAVGRLLHLGNGHEMRVVQPVSALVQTRKWLLVVLLSGRILRVDPDTGALVTVARSSQGGLVTDPAGTHVAWLASGAGQAVVVVRTVADGTVALSDEQAFPARPRCCDNPFVVNGMTQDGQVVASLPALNRAWVWSTPDAGTNDVRAVTGLGQGAISQIGAGGVVVTTESAGFVVGRLEGSRFVRIAVLRARQADFADPLGHRVVYVDEAGEIHVSEVRARGRSRRGPGDVRMLLPTVAEGFTSVRWEDAGHVLLDVSDASLPQGALVRCAVDNGACELAVRFDRPHLVAD